MASSFIVWYLFLAGIGAGAFFLAGIVDLCLRVSDDADIEDFAHITDVGLFVGPAIVALGSVFLILDLGIPERALSIFFSGRITLLSFGAWSIAAFFIAAYGSLVAGKLFDGRIGRVAELILHVAAVALSACVIVYSGVYLSQYHSVPFLNSPLIPILFAISALSAGIAFLAIVAFFGERSEGRAAGMRWLVRIDIAFIVAESIAAASFLVLSSARGDAVLLSLQSLFSGNISEMFWIGFVAIGIVFPLLVELLCLRDIRFPLLAAGACGSLVGCFCLRYTFLFAAMRFTLTDMMPLPFWM